MNKLEAVQRIAARTGYADDAVLAPGSTEYRSTLAHLAEALGLDSTGSKPVLCERIVKHGGLEWTDKCWSRGSTVTSTGLTKAVEVAERFLSIKRAKRK